LEFSESRPSVFRLLETVYHAFDQIASAERFARPWVIAMPSRLLIQEGPCSCNGALATAIATPPC
jgi:hypothetical protein